MIARSAAALGVAGLALAGALFGTPSAVAQTAPTAPIVHVTVSPAQPTVGDPISITVTVRHALSTEVVGEDGPSPLGALEPALPTVVQQPVDGGGVFETVLTYATRAFVTGTLAIDAPALRLRSGGGETPLPLPTITVTVRSVLPPTGPVTPRPLKAPFSAGGVGVGAWREIGAVSLGAGLALALAVWARRRRRRGPALGTGPGDQPPAQRATDALATIPPPASGAEVLAYCGRIEGAVRDFLALRYGIRAHGLTGRELAAALPSAGADARTVQRVRRLVQECDAVRYGGAAPGPERASRFRDLAWSVVAPDADAAWRPPGEAG